MRERDQIQVAPTPPEEIPSVTHESWTISNRRYGFVHGGKKGGDDEVAPLPQRGSSNNTHHLWTPSSTPQETVWMGQ